LQPFDYLIMEIPCAVFAQEKICFKKTCFYARLDHIQTLNRRGPPNSAWQGIAKDDKKFRI